MINPFAAIEIISVVYILIIMMSVVSGIHDAPRSTRFYILDLQLLFVGLIFDILAITVSPEHEKLLYAVNFFSLFFGATIRPVFAYYCVILINERRKILSVWHARIVLIVNAVTMIISLFAFFTGKFFVIKNGITYAGAFQILLHCIELASVVYICVVMSLHGKQINSRIFIALMFFAVVPVISAIIEVISPDIIISYSSMAVAAMVLYVIIQSRQINASRMRERIISEISRTDSMTGLKNRRAYSEFVYGNKGLVDAGVIFCDLNGLKRENDRYGHTEGDKLIIEFAELLKANFPDADIYRISGDEFVTVYMGENKLSVFLNSVEQMKKVISEKNDIASIGSVFGSHEQITDLINEAEKRMYADKGDYYVRTGIDRRRS